MADQSPEHGGIVGPPRRFWVWTDKQGKQQTSDTAPVGGTTGILGTGILAEAAPAATEYMEQIYRDGTRITWRFDSAGKEWTQVNYEVDPQIRAQHQAEQKGTDAGEIVTGTDGRKYRVVGNELVPLEGQEPRTTNKQLVWVDGKPFIFDPATGTSTPAQGLPEKAAEATAPKGTLPEVDLGAPRPGQRTDLRSLEAKWDAQIAAWNDQVARKQLTPEQANALWQKLYQEEVVPAAQRATQEANEYAAAQARRQAEQDERARETAERGRRLEEENAALRRGELEQDVRSDAVSNALKLLPYRTGPTFSADLAGIYNRILPGAFSPGAFSFDLPDLNAIADQAVARMMALHGTSVPARGSLPVGTAMPTGPGAPDDPNRGAYPSLPPGVPPVGPRPALPDPNAGPYPGALPPALSPDPNVGPYPGSLPPPNYADPLATLGFTPRRPVIPRSGNPAPAAWPPGITH